MPHINLIYPFRPKEEFEFSVGQFSRVCKNIEPFEIKLEEFFFFRHNRDCYTIWLAPEPKEAMVELQTMLWNVVPDCDDARKYEGGFTPHLSVGQASGEATVLQLLNMFQADWKTMLFTVNEVCLIWRDNPPNDVFRVVCTVSLGHLNL